MSSFENLPISTHELTNEMKEFRIKSLKKLIPELVAQREKRAGRRLLIVFVTLYIISFFVLLKSNIFKDAFFMLLFFSLIISFSLMFISYIIGFFTFFKNHHEAMIIEKLKTELATLNNEPEEDIDMLIEIGEIRSFL